MLRPIYNLLILTLIFFSCNRPETNPDTSKSTIEITDGETIKKDSIERPSEQDDRIKKINAVDGSFRKPYDTLSLEFNLSDKDYEVVYKKEEELYFFDSKSQEELIFPDTGRIFQFVLSSDGNTLYYTVINEEALVLKRANLLGRNVRISSLRIFDIPLHDFISAISGKGSEIEIHGDTLSIGHGMINEHYSFPSTVHIVSGTDSSYLIESLPSQYYQKRHEDYQAHIASVSGNLKLEKRGEHKELFLISNPDTIQLSDIQSLYNDSLYKEQNLYRDREYEVDTHERFDNMLFETVQFSPDGSKILYSYPCVLYDFVHGPMYLVNVNGDKLKMLSIDGGFSRDQRPVWLADGNKVIFHRYAKDDSSGLYMTINSENDFMRIAEKVDQFEIR